MGNRVSFSSPNLKKNVGGKVVGEIRKQGKDGEKIVTVEGEILELRNAEPTVKLKDRNGKEKVFPISAFVLDTSTIYKLEESKKKVIPE